MKDHRFCVYEHIRNDNKMCFYVGKGTLKRAALKNKLYRNQYKFEYI